ncbi:MAG: c-type cytochrome [Verrucomicrobiae bacterium]|nr:c-type cytochrome [Verrucomicrobiae bacterium]
MNTANRVLTSLGLLTGAVVLCIAGVDPGKLPAPAPVQGVTFDKDIKPLFEKSCVKCHGAEKQKGKYRLDSLEAALKPGESGDAVLKGDSAGSPLVHSISRLDPDIEMPPDGKADPLTPEQVALVRAWIDQGAK